MKTYPAFNYIDTSCDGEVIKPVGRILDSNPGNWPENSRTSDGPYYNDIKQLAPYIGTRDPVNDPYNYSMGVEKNPWCMAYMGVSVKTAPKIPFSPFGSVTLKARAFYKPFGGRIGPWYYSRWPSGSDKKVREINSHAQIKIFRRVLKETAYNKSAILLTQRGLQISVAS